MKKLIILFLPVFISVNLYSAPFKFLPHRITQPDGTVIKCYLSGDEFYSWIHDREGYTIMKGSDRYYYYADMDNNKIVPSEYRVNSIDPETTHLQKWIKISGKEYRERRMKLAVPDKPSLQGIAKSGDPQSAPSSGKMNNIVIYIRFSGESEIVTPRQEYIDKLNPETGITLKSYFNEVSYNKLLINSAHYPSCADPLTSNASYIDTNHLRGYFQPYDPDTNPGGYENDTERREREHTLLQDAITWVNEFYSVPDDLDIDADEDGYVDNICFMIKGDSDGWADLLWAHRWALYTYPVYINDKRVWDYTLQPENQVSVRTLCHEMFHVLGAPDLYHYDDDGLDLDPVGKWDIMEYGSGHMGAYMKWKYPSVSWIDSIPEITSSGKYSIKPLTEATNNCFRINSPNSVSEFFVVEYRKKAGVFESTLPGDGLLVYRINSDFYGNADFDNSTIFDEVYIYRPNGTTIVNGSIYDAYFSEGIGRIAINDSTTNPTCFLHDGTPGGLFIDSISAAGDSISFYCALPEYTITTIANPDSAGSTAGDSTYTMGHMCTVIAIPDTGYLFVNWTENEMIVTSDSSYSFPVTEDRTLVANFELRPYTISALSDPDTASIITGTGIYFFGDTAELITSSSTGYNFVNWSENENILTTDTSFSFMVTEDRMLIANFELKSFLISVQSNPDTAGSVTGSGIYFYGDSANLSATANTGYEFLNWTENGTVVATNSAFGFTITDNRILVANFALKLFNISVSVHPDLGGVVSGAGAYYFGDSVNLSAQPAANYEFQSWTENDIVISTDSLFGFIITEDRTLDANFSALTSIPMERGEAWFFIYPNPADESFSLVREKEGSGNTTIEILNITGKVIFREEKYTGPVNVSTFPKGIYFVRIRYNSGSVLRKLIIN